MILKYIFESIFEIRKLIKLYKINIKLYKKMI